jgi:hypothetical protein
VIHFERIPSRDPRLGRHVYHDDRSRLFAFPTAGLTLASTKHARRVPTLDQGQLGDCVPNAGLGCLGTDPFFGTLADLRLVYDEQTAVSLYSRVTAVDDIRGKYPPSDTGSNGLSLGKLFTTMRYIHGYTHTFSLDAALLALTVTPWIVGVNWYKAMFSPDPDGRVHPDGILEGGHEFVADELDVENERVWFTQSWGDQWGVVRDGRPGRFYLAFDDLGTLLGQQGDVTVFTPRTQPAPTPSPVPAPSRSELADRVLAAALHRESRWLSQPQASADGGARVASACGTWLATRP